MKLCPRCLERGKTWQGGDPVCAFPSPAASTTTPADTPFSEENWNCATMGRLRQLAVKLAASDPRRALVCRDDFGANSGAMVLVPEGEWNKEEVRPEGSFFLLLAWHKDRGCTDGASTMSRGQPTPLTHDEADQAIRIMEKLLLGVDKP